MTRVDARRGVDSPRPRGMTPNLRDTPSSRPDGWASSEAARRTMVGNRSRDTVPELALRRELRSLGLRGYRLHWPVPGAPRRSIDVAFVGRRLAVLVDGCFWHGCPEHGTSPSTNAVYWSGKVVANRVRDADTDRLLGLVGWHVLRCWTHEDPRATARAVAALLL